ncbi:hypothetical protein ACOMHN_051433 [Nucella lapillus]
MLEILRRSLCLWVLFLALTCSHSPMSNGSQLSSNVEPHATISAQDVVQMQPERYGFLRKRGQKERMLENLHLSRHINWRQRFVAVKDGCCYCFTDEVARAPLQTFSLEGYNRIYRARSERAAFVFTVEPAPNCRKKVHTFAATTNDERIDWMHKFKDAMYKANDVQLTPHGSCSVEPDDIYVVLEKPVYEVDLARHSQSLDDSFEDEEDEEYSDDSDYDRPDESLLEAIKERTTRKNVPLPPVPQDAAKNEVSSTAKRPAALLPPRSRLPSSSPDSSADGTFPYRSKPPDPRNRPALPNPPSANLHDSSPTSPANTLPKSRPPPPGPTPKPSYTPPAPALRPKPAVAVPAVGAAAKPSLPGKPVRRLSERDSFFDESDRVAAIERLKDSNSSPGTFLIRKSRQGDSKVGPSPVSLFPPVFLHSDPSNSPVNEVLVVMTTDDVKEYKMFTENYQVSLDKQTFFNTVDDLLEHYSRSPLPNRQQTLTRSYSTVSSRR